MVEKCDKNDLAVDIIEPKDKVNIVAKYCGSRGEPRMIMYSYYEGLCHEYDEDSRRARQ